MFETSYILFDDEQSFFISKVVPPTPPTPVTTIGHEPFEGRGYKSAVVYIESAKHRHLPFDIIVSYATDPISHEIVDLLISPHESTLLLNKATINCGSIATTLAMPVAYRSMHHEKIIKKLLQIRD